MTGCSGSRAAGLALAAALAAVCLAQPLTEPALWEEIAGLRQTLDAATPGEDWFADAATNRQRLLQRLETYAHVFPGGAHRDQVTALELETRFELGALAAGDFADLRQRSAHCAEHGPTPAIRAEAAYWLLLCDELQPSPAAPPDPNERRRSRLDSYRSYVDQFPRSRHAPRLSCTLFDDADQRHDLPAMTAIVARLQTHHKGHAVADQLAAALDLRRRVGSPFPLKFTADNGQCDPNALVGRPLLIVVWASFDPAAADCARAVDAWCSARRPWTMVGVNLDPTPELCRQAAERLGLQSLQVNDGDGRATWFVRRWGLRSIPRVLVIDAEGRLVGLADAVNWRRLAAEAGASARQD